MTNIKFSLRKEPVPIYLTKRRPGTKVLNKKRRKKKLLRCWKKNGERVRPENANGGKPSVQTFLN